MVERNVSGMSVSVGSDWHFYMPLGKPYHRMRVLSIEVAHILVEFPDIPEAGTGQRKWMSHDMFMLNAMRTGLVSR